MVEAGTVVEVHEDATVVNESMSVGAASRSSTSSRSVVAIGVGGFRWPVDGCAPPSRRTALPGKLGEMPRPRWPNVPKLASEEKVLARFLAIALRPPLLPRQSSMSCWSLSGV